MIYINPVFFAAVFPSIVEPNQIKWNWTDYFTRFVFHFIFTYLTAFVTFSTQLIIKLMDISDKIRYSLYMILGNEPNAKWPRLAGMSK